MYSVYTLNDPRNNGVRYVGFTSNTKARLSYHLGDEVNKPKLHWINELKKDGYRPAMPTIETVEDEVTARVREAYWLLQYLDQDLLNFEVWYAKEHNDMNDLVNRLKKRALLISSPPIVDLTTDHSIYILIDPRDGAIRYVGRSIDPEERYKHHIGLSGNPSLEKRQWILDLRKLGLKPDLEVIDRAENRKAAASKETYWIHHYTRSGADLFNGISMMRKAWG